MSETRQGDGFGRLCLLLWICFDFGFRVSDLEDRLPVVVFGYAPVAGRPRPKIAPSHPLATRLHPDQLLVEAARHLVGFDVVLQGRAQDFDPGQVGLTQAGLGAVIEVTDLGKIDPHQFYSDAIGGQPVRADHADAGIDGRAAGGTFAFHSFIAVNDRQVRVEPRGEGEEVVVNAAGNPLP